jgi:flagellar basal-body rod protein FlgC
MSFWSSIRIAASGLAAQRLRLDVISNNVANAETTRTENGGPYRRQDVVFQAITARIPLTPAGLAGQPGTGGAPGGVEVSTITTDDTPGPQVYDPTHPDADENGYVTYPNVNLVVEMTNMLSATRSYEAGLSVIAAVKQMAAKALEIGR